MTDHIAQFAPFDDRPTRVEAIRLRLRRWLLNLAAWLTP